MSTQKINFITTLALTFLLSIVTACQTTLPSIPESTSNLESDTTDQNDLDKANLLPDPRQQRQETIPLNQDNLINDSLAPETQEFLQGNNDRNQDDDDRDQEDDDYEGDLDDEETELTDDDGTEDSLSENHPVANALTQEFNITQEEIASLQQAGYGFGEIAKAYSLADELGMAPEDILSQAREVGWGKLLKDNGLHPSLAGKGNNLGTIMSEQKGNRPAHAGPPGGDGPPGLQKKNK